MTQTLEVYQPENDSLSLLLTQFRTVASFAVLSAYHLDCLSVHRCIFSEEQVQLPVERLVLATTDDRAPDFPGLTCGISPSVSYQLHCKTQFTQNQLILLLNTFTPRTGQTKKLTNVKISRFTNAEKQTAPCKRTAKVVSFEWSHRRVSSTNSKSVRNTYKTSRNHAESSANDVSFEWSDWSI